MAVRRDNHPIVDGLSGIDVAREVAAPEREISPSENRTLGDRREGEFPDLVTSGEAGVERRRSADRAQGRAYDGSDA
jgi:hypothetical protein